MSETIVKPNESSEKDFEDLPHPVTNEKIPAIMAGLDLKEDDNLLAVCSSGDVAFTAACTAKSVIAVDINPLQIAYAQRRKEDLLRNDQPAFLKLPRPLRGLEVSAQQARDLWWNEHGGIDKLRDNAAKITFKVSDIIEAMEKEKFSKIYLSNVLGGNEMVDQLNKISARLPKGGLIYMDGSNFFYCQIDSAPSDIINVVREHMHLQPNFSNSNSQNPLPDLQIDLDLTKKAMAIEKTWAPIILRKT